MHTQAALAEAGAPALRGELSGECAGVARVEVGSANQARPLAAVTAQPGPYVLRVPAGEPLRLRWGCDPDGDGDIEADAVGEAKLAALTADLALDLRLVDPTVAERYALSVGARAEAPPSPGPGGAAPDGGFTPPAGIAPADEAVGPPLPEGPPADAGPPPGAGAPLAPPR